MSNDGYLFKYYVVVGVLVFGIELVENVVEIVCVIGVLIEVCFFGRDIVDDLIV